MIREIIENINEASLTSIEVSGIEPDKVDKFIKTFGNYLKKNKIKVKDSWSAGDFGDMKVIYKTELSEEEVKLIFSNLKVPPRFTKYIGEIYSSGRPLFSMNTLWTHHL